MINHHPHKIGITGSDNATVAAAWCNSHYPDKCWDIGIPIIGQANYVFSFSTAKQASEFALRWV